jgi:hypothetical protein
MAHVMSHVVPCHCQLINYKHDVKLNNKGKPSEFFFILLFYSSLFFMCFSYDNHFGHLNNHDANSDKLASFGNASVLSCKVATDKHDYPETTDSLTTRPPRLLKMLSRLNDCSGTQQMSASMDVLDPNHCDPLRTTVFPFKSQFSTCTSQKAYLTIFSSSSYQGSTL